MQCIQESVGENCTMKWKLGEELQKCLRDFLKAAGIGKGVVPTFVLCSCQLTGKTCYFQVTSKQKNNAF